MKTRELKPDEIVKGLSNAFTSLQEAAKNKNANWRSEMENAKALATMATAIARYEKLEIEKYDRQLPANQLLVNIKKIED